MGGPVQCSSGCPTYAAASPLRYAGHVCLRLSARRAAQDLGRARVCKQVRLCAALAEHSTSHKSGHSASTAHTERGEQLVKWLKANGMPDQIVSVASAQRDGHEIDITVARRDLAPGDLALRIPEHLVITLDRVFEDGAVAELLTTDKLSELACLTLYLMYEKKRGEESHWHAYIRELDRQRARGQQGAKSPLLWEPWQLEQYLAGSPVVAQVKERLQALEKEYAELDTVWFMAGSLFRNYPYDIPTDAFPFALFKQAFAAVQGSVVHLQGVPLSRRFALVPLGPPLLAYSSTSKAMLKYDPERREVVLAADRAYAAGEQVEAWCGPQPNSRLLLNYGIVDERNPHDKLAVTLTIPTADPLFQLKRQLLIPHSLATQQAFQLLRNQPLPPLLLPYMRLAHAASETEARAAAEAMEVDTGPAPEATQQAVLRQLAAYLRQRLARYRSTPEQDEEVINSPTAVPREKVAARLLRIEKAILHGALDQVAAQPGGRQAVAAAVDGAQPHSTHGLKLT